MTMRYTISKIALSAVAASSIGAATANAAAYTVTGHIRAMNPAAHTISLRHHEYRLDGKMAAGLHKGELVTVTWKYMKGHRDIVTISAAKV